MCFPFKANPAPETSCFDWTGGVFRRSLSMHGRATGLRRCRHRAILQRRIVSARTGPRTMRASRSTVAFTLLRVATIATRRIAHRADFARDTDTHLWRHAERWHRRLLQFGSQLLARARTEHGRVAWRGRAQSRARRAQPTREALKARE